MIKAHAITLDTVDCLQSIYERFSEKARTEYGWAHDAVAFDVLRMAVRQRMIRGYWVEDTGLGPEPVGFMLYTLEEHRAIEINAIYTEIDDLKTVTDRLMRRFIEDIRTLQGWDVVSFAMLGRQAELVRTITWYGFKPIGQAILNFDMLDPVSIQILKQQQFDPLPEGYTLDTWKPEYAGDIAQVVFEAFSTAADAKWDPRFRSLLGARRVVATVTAGMMGEFLPDCTPVVLKDGKPVGFCFVVKGGPVEGNIPLIGVHPAEKGKGLGNRLLEMALNQCIDEMLAGRAALIKVNTTTDTDNIAAMRMYRRLGFRDEDHYPHVYLPQEALQSLTVGRWC